MSSKRLIAQGASVLLVLASVVTFEGTLAAAQNRPQPSKLFKKCDTNEDGFVSRGEAARLRGFGKIFADADKNHDGRLSVDEFAKAESMYERQMTAEYAEDGEVAAKVRATLFKDPEIKALDVSVQTYKGRVLLSGFVDNVRQAHRAVELASTVRGVESVENGLRTK